MSATSSALPGAAGAAGAASKNEGRLTGGELRLVACAAGGVLCDGYILGVVGPALAGLAAQRDLSSLESGLIGASALIGLFLGSLNFGWLTDRFGRQAMYVADLAAFIVLSIAQLWATTPFAVVVLRVLLGVAVGADYAIAPTLLAEVLPDRRRGPVLASLNAVWTVGYVLALAVGTALQGTGPDAWRWILASSAVPALVVALLRIGTPESPRWLARQNPDGGGGGGRGRVPLRTLCRPEYLRRLAFGGLFWCLLVVPYFAVFTYLPSVLRALHLHAGLASELAVAAVLLLGSVVGTGLVAAMSRRRFLTVAYGGLAVLAAGLALSAGAALAGAVVFVAFAFLISAAQVLTSVYPAELFPTAVRATGVGACTAISRIGAAVGTLLLPTVLSGAGVAPVLWLAVPLLLAGLGVTLAWAPETRSLSLEEAAGERPGEPQP